MTGIYVRFPAHAAEVRERAPLLERWLVGAAAPVGVADWRAEALRLTGHAMIASEAKSPGAVPLLGVEAGGEPAALAAAPPLGVAAWHAAQGAGAAWVAIATPVHLVAGLNSVRLAEEGILSVDAAQAEALVRDFNRTFDGGGVRLAVMRERMLLCLFDEILRVALVPPDDCQGAQIGAYLPSGADGGRLRRLASEIEMWLFDHPVNQQRRRDSLPVISGLWLWGGGAVGDASARFQVTTPGAAAWVSGDEPLSAVLERVSRYPGSRAGVVALQGWPGSEAWREAEARWLVPAIEDLKTGRLDHLDWSLGRRRVRLRAPVGRRFWRRSRPWWEVLGHDD